MVLSFYWQLLVLCFVSELSSASSLTSTLTLTDDVALEDILADVPFFSVGLVGFAAFTFSFVMQRLNKLTLYIHAAVLLGFLASIFDVSQVLRRGSNNTQHGTGTSQVLALIYLRELCLSGSFGIRFFFYWAYVSEPPRGELPLLPFPDDRRPNFISLNSEKTIHSASWAKWSYLGHILKWSLLLMTIAVTPLQGLWRLVTEFQRFGPVYFTEGTLQIVLSAIFILKLVANACISNLSPRWKTLRNYSPVILALAISMGVGIGNIFFFEFCESSLGRLLQAVEMYIIILFVLISAFYNMPVRTSVVLELVRRGIDGAGVTGLSRPSVYTMNQDPYRPLSMGPLERSAPSQRTFSQRMSSASLFSSRILSRRFSLRQGLSYRDNLAEKENDMDAQRLWEQDEAERGQVAQDQRPSLEQTPNQTPMEPKEVASWKDPVLTSVVQNDADIVSQSLTLSKPSLENTMPLEFGRPIITSDEPKPSPAFKVTVTAPTSRTMTDSPVYGLDGIIARVNANTPQRKAQDRLSIVSSPDADSLVKQVQDLEKSISDLRNFSLHPSRRSTTKSQSESMRSDISLSNFPKPPNASRDSSQSSTMSSFLQSDNVSPCSEVSSAHNELTIDGGRLMVDDVEFQLVTPRMPVAMEEGALSQTGSPIIRGSTGSDVIGPRDVRSGPEQGTRYEITSFIGGLTAPSASKPSPLSASPEEVQECLHPESDVFQPAPTSSLDLSQSSDGRRFGDSADRVVTESKISVAPAIATGRNPLPSINMPEELNQPYKDRSPSTSSSGSTSTADSQMSRVRGLPSGVRGKLGISSPIPKVGGVLNERVVFERPRPAPLILQNANDTKPMPAAGKPSRFL